MLSYIFVLFPFLVGVSAANDWSVPCITGVCQYDLPGNGASAASGSLKIWGSTDAITDITTAADWEILDCNSTALAQDIRLVCMNDPNQPDSKCGHLYQNIGAVNKIVRLPENCGASAFARVAKAWVPEDQSIPAHVQARLVRRAGAQPVVKALHIDTNFDAADWSKTGMVNIAIQGANVPGTPTDVVTPGSRARRASRRGLGDFLHGAIDSIGDGINNAAGDVKSAAHAAATDVKNVATKAESAAEHAATKAASAAKGVATKAATAVKGGATKAASAAKGAATKAESVVKNAATKAESVAKNAATKVASAAKNAASDVAGAAKSVANKTIDVNKNFDLPPLTFDKSVNLLDSSVSCLGESLSLSVDMDGTANMQAILSVAALGTIIPPKITQFSINAVMSGTVGGTLQMTADATGSITSGKVPLVNIGIPGLDFPGILTIGPSFQVDALVEGEVDVTMDMTLGVSLDLSNATIAFPPASGSGGAPEESAFTLGDTPVTLDAAADVQATGTITAHVIPSLNLGVSALGGKGEAEIFLALDASAAMTMNLDGSTGKSVDVNGGASANDTTTDDSTTGTDDTTDDGTTDTTDATDGSTGTTDDSTGTTDDSTDTTDDSTDTTDDATTDDSTDDSTAAADDDATDNASDGATNASDGATKDSRAVADEDGSVADDSADDLETTSSDDGAADGSAAADDATTDDTTDGTTDDTATTDTDDGTDDSTDDSDGTSDTTPASTLGGCINVAGNINVNVGADGSFFGLFNKVASKSLFNKDFKIFNKCFGDEANSTDASATADDSTADAAATDDSTADATTDVTADDGATDDSTGATTDDSADATTGDSTDATADATTRRRRSISRSIPRVSSLQRRISLACPVGNRSKVGVTKQVIPASRIRAV